MTENPDFKKPNQIPPINPPFLVLIATTPSNPHHIKMVEKPIPTFWEMHGSEFFPFLYSNSNSANSSSCKSNQKMHCSTTSSELSLHRDVDGSKRRRRSKSCAPFEFRRSARIASYGSRFVDGLTIRAKINAGGNGMGSRGDGSYLQYWGF